MEIETARPADAEALAAVFTASRLAAMPWLPRLHSAAEDRRFVAEQVLGASDEVLVVRRDERPVAFLALRGAMVEHLYVEPSAQRAGIGSVLLDAAKSRRPAGLRLWVFQRNEDARAFYARHGFAELERTDGAGNEEGEPDVLLEWLG
jgi:GNAT superfamily N-acetyltransferase